MAIDSNELSNWASYEYIGPEDNFIPVQTDPHGGPAGQPCISADDSMWTIDTPESPHSILALLFYPLWQLEGPYDLRNAQLQFYLRGDDLDLKGGHCFFWVHTSTLGSTRWHLRSQAIPVSQGQWGEKITIKLSTDTSLWHQSFVSDPAHGRSLPLTLKACSSFGFSFLDFSEKVTGRLSLSDFSIERQYQQNWPYNAALGPKGNCWLTVSRREKRQLPMASEEISTERSLGSVPFDFPSHFHLALCQDDFLTIPSKSTPFCYLGFTKTADSTKNEDLRHSFVMARQFSQDLDLKGGTIHFFVEQTATSTIWVFRSALIDHSGMINMILRPEPHYWFRLQGNAPLESVLAGNQGEAGYDYFGFLVMAPQDTPTGTWGLYQFSIGPRIKEDFSGA